MARLSKKHKTAIVNTVTRWAHTIAGTRSFNLERVSELIKTAYRGETKQIRLRKKNKKTGATNVTWKRIKIGEPTIHVMQSPLAFKIAAAVCRGYISKKKAYEAADAFGIDRSFIAPLRRSAMRSFKQGGRNYWYESSPLMHAWSDNLSLPIKAATLAAFERTPGTGRWANDSDADMVRRAKAFESSLADIPEYDYRQEHIRLTNNLYTEITGVSRAARGSEKTQTWIGNFYSADVENEAVKALGYVPRSSTEDRAVFDRLRVAPIEDRYGANYIDTEIMFDLLDINDLSKTWRHELMHEAACVMTFEESVLVLDSRPVVKYNGDGELHCEDGPAVYWPDGAKMYYVEGHTLREQGKLICETPDRITLAHIKGEENEEIKRLMIDRYGWGRYLHDIEAVVVDRRENWVDNTVEALVEMTEHRTRQIWGGWGRGTSNEQIAIKKRKLVLACRSTGRQYFLSVPEETKTCEEGQRWMGGGANTAHVPALSYPVRLVGAS